MDFQTVKQAAVTTLGNGAGGNFLVIGYQKQNKSADRINENRLVQVYYDSGNYPTTGGKIGPIDHDITLHIQLTVVADAKADLTVINNAGSTPAQLAAAIQGISNAAEGADSEIDDLISRVWNILMDARNQYLGLAKGFISSRWIPSVKKDQTVEDGKFAVKTALMVYTCETAEEIQGDTGVKPTTVILDSTVNSGDTEIGTEVDNVST